LTLVEFTFDVKFSDCYFQFFEAARRPEHRELTKKGATT